MSDSGTSGCEYWTLKRMVDDSWQKELACDGQIAGNGDVLLSELLLDRRQPVNWTERAIHPLGQRFN
jgi:hypothetical protein